MTKRDSGTANQEMVRKTTCHLCYIATAVTVLVPFLLLQAKLNGQRAFGLAEQGRSKSECTEVVVAVLVVSVWYFLLAVGFAARLCLFIIGCLLLSYLGRLECCFMYLRSFVLRRVWRETQFCLCSNDEPGKGHWAADRGQGRVKRCRRRHLPVGPSVDATQAGNNGPTTLGGPRPSSSPIFSHPMLLLRLLKPPPPSPSPLLLLLPLLCCERWPPLHRCKAGAGQQVPQ